MKFGVFSVYWVIWANFHYNKNPLLDAIIPLLHVILEENNKEETFLQHKWP